MDSKCLCWAEDRALHPQLAGPFSKEPRPCRSNMTKLTRERRPQRSHTSQRLTMETPSHHQSKNDDNDETKMNKNQCPKTTCLSKITKPNLTSYFLPRPDKMQKLIKIAVWQSVAKTCPLYKSNQRASDLNQDSLVNTYIHIKKHQKNISQLLLVLQLLTKLQGMEGPNLPELWTTGGGNAIGRASHRSLQQIFAEDHSLGFRFDDFWEGFSRRTSHQYTPITSTLGNKT